EYPAASRFVTAVGGTALARATSSSRGWVESVWGSARNANGGAGSGCSAYTPKPSWQSDLACSTRTVADVSAVADPASGVAVNDGSSSALSNGVSLSGLAGGKGSHTRYTFSVPASSTQVRIAISGGTGNANLYVKADGQATTRAYDCRSAGSTSTDACTFTN